MNVSALTFARNGLSASHGLNHITRLLQHPSSSLWTLVLDFIPGLFDNPDSNDQFLRALQESEVTLLSMNFCQIPGHFMVALFQALAMKTSSTELHVYDQDPLHGEDLERLLEVIPETLNLRDLRINLDYTNESVLSCFRQNTSIEHLYTLHGPSWKEMTSGPLLSTLQRNRSLYSSLKLLVRERCLYRRTQEPLAAGVWCQAMEHIGRDSTGATGLYMIMQDKLVSSWCPPRHNYYPAAAAAAAAATTSTDDDAVANTGTAAADHSATTATPLLFPVAAAAAPYLLMGTTDTGLSTAAGSHGSEKASPTKSNTSTDSMKCGDKRSRSQATMD